MMRFIDLFCGCGGISEGMRSCGLTPIVGVDIEKKYICTYEANFPQTKAIIADLSTLAPQNFCKKFSIAPESVDIVVGGPPCQGFSKNTPRSMRTLDSDNNRLILTFLNYCEFFKPKLILMENVAEMKNGFEQSYTEEIVTRLSSLGYNVNHSVLNAADYGVPQLRRRAFFIASRVNAKRLKFPSKQYFPASECLSLIDKKKYITVWEAIGDLPSLKHGEGENLAGYAVAAFSDYQKKMRNKDNVVKNHIARQLKPLQYARLAALNPGQSLKDLPKELQVKGGYSGAYGRLTKEMVCRTITRWVFHPGSGRWGHPVDVRTLSIREVARIQGFKDSFEFIGSYTQQASQLGNAVPPLLVESIMRTILNQLSNYA